MKNKSKIIISSLLGVLLSTGVSARATYALFTSNDSANICVTSGNVEATAEVKDLELFSANPYLDSGDVVPGGDQLGDHSGTYYYEDRTEEGTFINEGTATLSDGDLTLDRMSFGDMVKAKFVVTNDSTIDVKYRLVAECTSTDDDGLKLFAALKFTALGETKTNVKKYYTSWTLWTADDEERTNETDLKIEMPLTLGKLDNYYQGLSADIKLSVEMVQANAAVADAEDEILYFDNSNVVAGNTASGMENTTLTAGGTDAQPDFKVEIPTATLNEIKANGSNVVVGDTLTLIVQTSAVSSSIVVGDNEIIKNFDIKVIDQENHNITSVNTKIKIYIYIGEDQEVLRVYHKDVQVMDYDYENGYVIFETADFSPFTVVLFDQSIEATIGNDCYTKLADALAAVKDGETVILHKSVVASETYSVFTTEATIVIDLHGHKVTVNNSTDTIDRRPAFVFSDKTKGTSQWTLKNGTIEAKDNCDTGIYATNGVFKAEDLTVINNNAGYFAIEARCNSNILRNVKTVSTLGGGFYANHGTTELFDCTAVQTGFNNHTSTGLAAANGAVMICHNVTVTSENYGAYVFSSGGTITLHGGTVTATGTKEAILAGTSTDYQSKINVIGTAVNGAIAKGTSKCDLYVFEGTFTVDPTAFKYADSTVSGPVEGIYTVALEEGKTALVYDDTYNHRVYIVNDSDLSADGKLISGDYTLDSPENTLFVEDGYAYIGSWSGGFICQTSGSNSSTGSAVSMKISKNSNAYVIYYSSLEDCLDEADDYTVTSITLRKNVEVEGDFASTYTIGGSSYTLTVDGTVSSGTYDCKVSANAITGGTYNAAVTVANGGITGGLFKVLPAEGALASGLYYVFGNNMYVVKNNITNCNAYYVANNTNVYGAYDDIYAKGNITLLDDVTTTKANAVCYYIVLNGHTFNLTNATLSAITSKDSTKVLIVKTALVSESKLNFGSYSKTGGADLNDYPIVEGASVVVGYNNYIVKTEDLDNNSKLYKGVYTFDMSGVFAEGYDDANVKDTSGNTWYVTGKDMKVFDNKIIAGEFKIDPTEYVLTGKVIVTENAGTWTVAVDESKAVAQIGTNKYVTVGLAVAAAVSGDTITILADDTVNSVLTLNKANIVVDLNEHTLTLGAGLTQMFSVAVSSATVKNGTVISPTGFIGCTSTSNKLKVEDLNVTCTTLITTFYKCMNIVSGTFNVEVIAKYVASGSSVAKVGDNWVVSKNA